MTDESPLVTFAMPYMNGPLHLGHLYTLMNGWAIASHKFKKFTMPFAFHCTGMPIYSNAMRLKNGDQAIVKILDDLNIPFQDHEKFKDPEYWVRYFPKKALETLLKFNLPNIDLTKSFITTSINPYFSKFVEWQWTTLHLNNFTSFKKRPCIYSIKDGQPCAAHDRQIGEQATPVKIQYLQDGHITPSWIMEMPVKHINEYLILNYKGQTDKNYPFSYNSKDIIQLDVLVPSEKTLSRSGDICIVATTEQWYVNYSNEEWKRDTLDYIKTLLIVKDNEVLKQLVIACENMHDWCISREYGLGTRIPWDKRFLIDSLSDSTIYPMYYNFAEVFQSNDIIGDCSLLDPEVLTLDFFNAVFLKGDFLEGLEGSQLIKKLKGLIKPVHLRVSGKDLIYNHLVMAIYHGIAFKNIFKTDVFLFKEYHVNGYVKVNGEKMSKSLGNFVTMEEAISKYPKKSLIMALIEAGDGLNDANVRLSDIEQITASLKKTISLIHNFKNIDSLELQDIMAESEQLKNYKSILYECLKNSKEAWQKGRVREAVSYGWRKCQKAFDKYNQVKSSEILNYYAVKIMAWNLKFLSRTNDEDDFPTEEPDFSYILNSPCDSDLKGLNVYLQGLKKFKQLYECNCEIIIHHGISDKPGNLERVKKFLLETFPTREFLISIDQTVIHEKRDPYKVKPVVNIMV